MKNKNARFQVFYNRKENRLERIVRHYNELEIENYNLEKLLTVKDILHLLFCKIFTAAKKEAVDIYNRKGYY
jgi:hypothetical protein